MDDNNLRRENDIIFRKEVISKCKQIEDAIDVYRYLTDKIKDSDTAEDIKNYVNSRNLVKKLIIDEMSYLIRNKDKIKKIVPDKIYNVDYLEDTVNGMFVRIKNIFIKEEEAKLDRLKALKEGNMLPYNILSKIASRITDTSGSINAQITNLEKRIQIIKNTPQVTQNEFGNPIEIYRITKGGKMKRTRKARKVRKTRRIRNTN